MTGIFLTVLKMNLGAVWCMLAVIVLRFALRKVPKWTHCLLWAVAAVQLILPVTIRSAFSLLPQESSVGSTVQYGGMVAQLPSTGSVLEAVKNTDFLQAFAVIWMIVAILLLLYGVGSYLLVRRRAAVSVRYRENIYFCDDIDTPFILGIIRPRICLPSGMDAEQVEYVILHERAHLKRGDHIWKPLSFVLLAVHWFNPLVWAAYVLFNRDAEQACDERTICDMDLAERKLYSDILLSCSAGSGRWLICPVSFGELGAWERIGSVMLYQKPEMWRSVVMVFLSAAVALCLCTVPKEIPKNMVYVPANQSNPVPGEIVDQWIVFERNGISLEKLKCCSCGRGTPSAISYSIAVEKRSYETCEYKSVVHWHEYGKVYAEVTCSVCGGQLDAYYVGDGYRCDYEDKYFKGE